MATQNKYCNKCLSPSINWLSMKIRTGLSEFYTWWGWGGKSYIKFQIPETCSKINHLYQSLSIYLNIHLQLQWVVYQSFITFHFQKFKGKEWNNVSGYFYLRPEQKSKTQIPKITNTHWSWYPNDLYGILGCPQNVHGSA